MSLIFFSLNKFHQRGKALINNYMNIIRNKTPINYGGNTEFRMQFMQALLYSNTERFCEATGRSPTQKIDTSEKERIFA